MLERIEYSCELCVVGGGMAGIAAAISAAREGLSVVLMHERPVLGGNASSEIRMWICGAHGEDNRETGILEEIQLENLYRNPTKNYAIWDTVLYEFVRRESNITLLLNCACMDAKIEEGRFADGRDRRILSVSGYQMTTQRFCDVRARFFADCSGDSILAPLTGAAFRFGREAGEDFGEDTDRTEADAMTMGMSCLVQGRETTRPVPFTPPAFATPLSRASFAHRNPDIYNDSENFWYLELGGNRNSIADTETLRDELVALAAGTWDYIKNSGDFRAENWELDFLGFLPGKRESRRLCGEYTVTQRDISDGRVFPDEIAFGGWPLDDHFPGGFYHKGEPNTYGKTPAPYSLPYRALYSKNVENLFFAGRNISMTHLAMSSIRVMATCALLGEAVGKAAAVATRRGVTPNGVYLAHMDEVQALLQREDAFLPSRRRAISAPCANATLRGADDRLRNGEDRGHRLYGTAGRSGGCAVALGGEIAYDFPRSEIASAHIVFDSDLNRVTLPGSHCERIHGTRANTRLDSPDTCLPKTLCRAFVLWGVLDGEKRELARVTDNRRRAYEIPIGQTLDGLVLSPLSSWGDGETVDIVSFDFEA